VPDFSAGVSQYLLINIKLHKESDDSRLTSSQPLLMDREAGAKTFRHPDISVHFDENEDNPTISF
jgi:hypothetical protein